MRRLDDPYVHSFDFAITTHCQAACRSCPRTGDDGKVAKWLNVEHMPFEVFAEIIDSSDYIKKDTTYACIFCGEFGDPMMHPEITKFVDKAFEKFDRVEINTNGGLRQPKWYENFAKKYQNKMQIHFAIDGMDHDTNWKYREGVVWERAIENMLTFNKNGGLAVWHFLVFDWNWQQLPAVKEFAEKNNIDVMYKINVRDWGLVSKEGLEYAQEFLDLL